MTAPNIFQSVLDIKTTLDTNTNDAAQIAINAQTALQQIQNNEAAGNASVFSWNTVFSGADGTSLNGTDFSSSTGIKIRGSNGFAGVDDTMANGLYRADIAYPFLTSNQSVSVVIGSIDAGSTAVSYTLFQCNSTRTAGAYLYLYANEIRIGKFTRSGSTYTFNTPLATVNLTSKPLKAGDIVRAYNTGATYYVKVNTVQRIAITDSGNTITRNSSNVYTSFLMERNSFLYVGDGPRLSSFAMSDDLGGGVPVSDSWLFTRSSQTTVALSINPGDSALIPASFYSTQNYITGASLDTLGTGKVLINNSSMYELTCATIGNIAVYPPFSVGVKVGLPWAVYVNGAQITGPIPCGATVKVQLNATDIVQPMICASGFVNNPSTGTAGSGGSNALSSAPNVSSVQGFSSWSGLKVAA